MSSTNAVSAIRVLLAANGLAADLLERRLRGDRDFELVGRCADPDRLLEAARQTRPDFVVVVAREPRLRSEAVDLFDSNPTVKVLTLESAAGRAYLCELISDVGPDEIVEALRRAATREQL